MSEWFDDDAWWQATHDVMFTEQRQAGTASEIDQVVEILDLPPAAPVLDLCCGPGRHARELARRGFHVTGVDRTQAYLDRAGEGAPPNLELVQADMREFRRDGGFLAAVNLYTSFGYFRNPADDRRVLENLYLSLAPGGTLLMELNSKEIAARDFRERDWHELPDGRILLEHRTVRGPWEFVDNAWTLIDGAERRTYKFTTRCYAATELRALLQGVGFGSIEVWGGLDRSPYDHLARRMVVRAIRS